MSAIRARICLECTADLDHCHGTLIEHRDALAECTDPECVSLAGERHPLVVSCAEIDGCACESESRIEFLTAS
ncbi:hypothetical protein SAMN05444695_12114 [Rhodococcus triatomae]|uniref:Uncharacterized protein n=1 Tax=Rhodococcus triatomae TaxID=300028 RepID=A0A1G8SFG9_9NOCA|nr:hypothetical protein [Rhodococcus triatomae]SDJ27420.1 hypothetical protein SAMN05444695_12114 [Rhodococcus triatomae]